MVSTVAFDELLGELLAVLVGFVDEELLESSEELLSVLLVDELLLLVGVVVEAGGELVVDSDGGCGAVEELLIAGVGWLESGCGGL